MSTLFYATSLPAYDLRQLAAVPAVMAEFVDTLGPCTQVDLADGVPDDWELGVSFLPGMDEVRVEAAALELRGLRVLTPAEGWSCVAQANGWKITLAQPARLVSITFDDPQPVAPLAPGESLRLLLSPASPAGPPAFMDPPFALGPAYANIAPRISQRTVVGGRVVAKIVPTLGTSWLLQWGVGNDATTLTTVAVTTTVRAVSIERAVAGARLELRPDESGGDPVLVWNQPGVLDPAAGLQAIDMSSIARKRLSDRLAAANASPTPPPTLTLPVRLVAATGGPVGVSGTDLRVTYAVEAVQGGTRLALRGDPLGVSLTVPAALRPGSGGLSINAHHLGRELNGPVGRAAVDGGPGTLVTAARWAALALPVVAGGPGLHVTLAAVTIDASADDQAELSVELRADTQGLPGAVLASAVFRLEPGPRLMRELVFDAPPTVAVGAVVWVSARATTGTVRWYADTDDRRPALPAVLGAILRTSADRGETWQPDEGRLTGATMPRARLLHRIEPPYTPPTISIHAGEASVATLDLVRTGATPDEFALTAGSVPAALLDLVGRTSGTGRTNVDLRVVAQAALDLTITGFELVYPPSAGPTGS